MFAAAAAPAITSLGGAVSKAMATVSKNSPHVTPTSVVTAFHNASHSSDYLKRMLASLLPEAMANTVSALSVVWDPESGSPPAGTDIALTNGYFDSSALYGCDMSNAPLATKGGAPCTGAFDYVWTGPSGTGTKVPTFVSARSYLGQQLDPNFKNANGSSTTLFGRMANAMGIPCTLGFVFTSTDADGTPSVSTGETITFPSSTSDTIFLPVTSGGCGMDVSMAGVAISYVVVTAVSGSSLYTKKITLTVPGGNPITMYIGLDLTAGSLNFMSVEDQANASGRDAVDRTMVSATGMSSAATTVLKFEYASIGFNGSRNSSPNCWDGSQWNCDFEFHRMFIDGPNDVAYVISNTGSPGDTTGVVTQNTAVHAPSFYVQFTGTGKPIELGACTAGSCSQTIALSLGMAGQNSANGGHPSTPIDYNGCFNAGALSLASDDTLACDRFDREPGSTQEA